MREPCGSTSRLNSQNEICPWVSLLAPRAMIASRPLGERAPGIAKKARRGSSLKPRLVRPGPSPSRTPQEAPVGGRNRRFGLTLACSIEAFNQLFTLIVVTGSQSDRPRALALRSPFYHSLERGEIPFRPVLVLQQFTPEWTRNHLPDSEF